MPTPSKEDVNPVATSPFGDAIIKEPQMDALDRNRHVWTKGRFESMGGPVMFTQGHGIPGYENNERKAGNPPLAAFGADVFVKDLGVDTTEQ